jgi:hypothetical protein
MLIGQVSLVPPATRERCTIEVTMAQLRAKIGQTPLLSAKVARTAGTAAFFLSVKARM